MQLQDWQDSAVSGRAARMSSFFATVSCAPIVTYLGLNVGRSWISQWSVQRSNADGVKHIRRVTVPTIFIENSADDGVPRSETERLFT